MSKKKILYKVAEEVLLKYELKKDSNIDYWEIVEVAINEHINTGTDLEKILKKFLKTSQVEKKSKILEVETLLEELKLDEPKVVEELETLESVEVPEKKERKNKRKNNE
jgi:hypothetical protein